MFYTPYAGSSAPKTGELIRAWIPRDADGPPDMLVRWDPVEDRWREWGGEVLPREWIIQAWGRS